MDSFNRKYTVKHGNPSKRLYLELEKFCQKIKVNVFYKHFAQIFSFFHLSSPCTNVCIVVNLNNCVPIKKYVCLHQFIN